MARTMACSCHSGNYMPACLVRAGVGRAKVRGSRQRRILIAVRG
jgi:hypothetical protein